MLKRLPIRSSYLTDKILSKVKFCLSLLVCRKKCFLFFSPFARTKKNKKSEMKAKICHHCVIMNKHISIYLSTTCLFNPIDIFFSFSHCRLAIQKETLGALSPPLFSPQAKEGKTFQRINNSRNVLNGLIFRSEII